MDEVGLSELNEVLLAESRGVVIDFWGTWCAPCRSLRPHLEKMASDSAEDWRFVAVHVESHEDLVVKYDVQSTPTLGLREGRRRSSSLSGATTPSASARRCSPTA